jgi:endoglucanase
VKQRLRVLTGTLLLVLLCLDTGAAQLPLGSVRYFDPYTNPTNWGGWGSAIYQGGAANVRNIGGTVPVGTVSGKQALVLDSVNPPGGWWNVYFKVSGNSLNYLRTGTNPAVHLQLRWSALPTNGNWNMNITVEGTSVPLSNYISPSTVAWQDIYIPASDFIAKEPDLDLTHIWAIALQPVGNYRDHCILNISAMDLVPSADPNQRTYAEFIKVNQVGYGPLMPSKLALVSWQSNTITFLPSTFQVVSVSNQQAVFTGSLTRFVQGTGWPAPDWDLDGDVIYQAEFGAFRTPGVYCLEVPELGARSPEFQIATNIYQRLFRDALRFFYYSRSGVPMVQPFAEGYTRSAVHPETTNAFYNYDPNFGHYDFGTNKTRDVHGAWFDAGDTHMDVPNTATACWFLLEAFRDFSLNVPPEGLNLPESNAARSDLVPLIYQALDWMKRMQNTDGSVCHYVMGDPNTAAQVQKVSDISSFAAASAAAVFAKAVAVLGAAIPAAEQADLLARARLSWAWLQANTGMVQPRLPLQNGVDPGADDTNPYWGDALADRRERAFAAVELFEATGESAFHDYFLAQFEQNDNSPLDGPVFGFNKTGYGIDNVLTYLNHPLNFAFMDYVRSSRAVVPTVRNILKNAFLTQANKLTNYTALAGYRIPMLYPSHLYWGSSGGVLAPSAIVLARAFEWTGKTNYHETAAHALHFICGRNPVGRIFVSGYGEYQRGSDFYSQFWTDLLHQPPGYLGGNINVDGSAKPVIEFPWKRFVNSQDADMTEPGVYWNSAFAWVAGYFANDSLPPALAAVPGNGSLTLSWPARSVPFTLLCSTNLSPAAWVGVTNSASLSNGVWTVALPAAGEAFYRLRN